MLQCLSAEGLDLDPGGIGFQQRVVDQGRQIPGSFGGGDLGKGPVVETTRIPKEAEPFHATQQLCHPIPW